MKVEGDDVIEIVRKWVPSIRDLSFRIAGTSFNESSLSFALDWYSVQTFVELVQSSLTCRDLEPVISYFLSRHYISCLHFLSVSSSVRNRSKSLLLQLSSKVQVLLRRYLYSLLSNSNVRDNILISLDTNSSGTRLVQIL